MEDAECAICFQTIDDPAEFRQCGNCSKVFCFSCVRRIEGYYITGVWNCIICKKHDAGLSNNKLLIKYIYGDKTEPCECGKMIVPGYNHAVAQAHLPPGFYSFAPRHGIMRSPFFILL